MAFGFFGGDKKRVAEMISAARTGDTEKIKQLLSKGVDVNVQEPESGDTPILAAIDNDQWPTAELLLQHRPDLSLEDDKGNSPLFLAVSRGDSALAMVNLLLASGANPDQGPSQGTHTGATPLHIACAVGANGCVEGLLRNGASPTRQLPDGASPLHTAAIGGDETTIEMLCEAGGNVAALSNHQRTPLHNCGVTGNFKAAAALVRLGARIDPRDSDGCTPLMRAVKNNHTLVAKVLLDNGADPNLVLHTENTSVYPLLVASMAGSDDMVRLLLEKGASTGVELEGIPSPVDAAKSYGHDSTAKLISSAIKRQKLAVKSKDVSHGNLTLLWRKIAESVCVRDFASLTKHTKSKDFGLLEPGARLLVWSALGDAKQLQCLLDAGTDPNRRFDDVLGGISPLYAAVALSGSVAAAGALLHAGADPNLKWENDATPIFEALKDDRIDLLRTLIGNGADVNSRMTDGMTPLIFATTYGSRLCVDCLLDAGANINEVNPSNGLGSFGVAVDRLNMDLAWHLLNRGASPDFGTTETLGLAVAEFGTIELIRAIENAGGSIIRADQLGRIAFVGSRNKDFEVLDYLLEHGADLSHGNDCQYSPLILSVLRGHVELVKRFVERGDDTGARDADGETALSLAIEKGQTAMISILRQSRAETKDYPDLPLEAAMLQASQDGALGSILDLHDAGVSINVVDAEGNSPLILAAQAGHLGVVRSLFHLGGDLNHRNQKGQSAAIVAADMDNPSMLATMKEFGAEDAIPEALKAISPAGIHDLGDLIFGRSSRPGKESAPYDSSSDSQVPDEMNSEEMVEPDVEDPTDDNSSEDELLDKLVLLRELIVKPHIADTFDDETVQQIISDIEAIQADGLSDKYAREKEGLLGLLEELQCLPEEDTRPAVFVAAADGDLAQLRQLLRAGEDANSMLEDGTTALMKAAEQDHIDIASELIKCGANVNHRRDDGISAFLMACFFGHEEIVKTLAKQGADVNARYEIGSSQGTTGNQTSLTVAAQKGNPSLCKLLVKLGSDVNVVSDVGYTPLMWALVNGASEEVALFLLKSGANPDPEVESKVHFSSSTTPLILAATNGMTTIVEALIKIKVNLDKRDGDGWTALKRASNAGHTDVVRALLEAGAATDIKDDEGWTALVNAAGNSHLAICTALLNAGADVNAMTDSGRTALLQAIGSRGDNRALSSLRELRHLLDEDSDDEQPAQDASLDLIKIMLNAGANPDVLDRGTSLLASARSNDDEELALLLIERGAHVSPIDEAAATGGDGDRDGDGEPDSAAGQDLLIAAIHADPKALKELVLAGANVNHASSEGQTALGFLLARMQNESNDRMFVRNGEQCLDFLLTHGANPNVGDPSPFVLAAMGHKLHLVQAMLSAGVDIDQSIGVGQTALFMSLLAPGPGKPADDRCALALLKAGADASQRHESGAMPVHLAAASNYLGALQDLLIRRPQDVNAQTRTGITPLMTAATEGHADAINLLLKFGADRAVKDDDGLTAKDVAIKNGHGKLVSILI